VKWLLFASAMVVTPVQAPARPQAPAVAAGDETGAEQLSRALLRQLNAPGSSREFVERNFTERALKAESAAERAAVFDRLAGLSGGFDLVAIARPTPSMTEMTVRSRRGARAGRIVVFFSSRDAGKISNVFVLPTRDPAKAEADRFPAGPVSDRQLVSAVTRRIDNLTDEDLFSGAVLVARGDKILLQEARGFADAATGTANSVDTRFNVGSMSKMWTAVIVLRLVEQGVLSLDDTVAKWVPEYPHAEAAGQMRLAALLQHTAGVGEWDVRADKTPRSHAEAAAGMAAPPTQPDRFAYSNAGYVLLAAAAERATGEGYDQLLQRLVFQPAGMAQSGLWPVTAIVPNRARGYLRPQSDPLGFGERQANEQYLGYAGDASGGAYSTLGDLFKFHRALANGTLVSAATFARMQDNALTMAGAPRPMSYGLGLRLESCSGRPMIGHAGGGAGSGVSAASYASPDGSWTVIVLGNVDPEPDALAFDICRLVNQR